MKLLTTPDDLGPCQVYCEELKTEVRRLERELAEARKAALAEGIRSGEAEADLAALRQLQDDHWNMEGEGHSEPCTYGALCPYCEIERMKPRHAEAVKASFHSGYMAAFMDHGGEWKTAWVHDAWERSSAKQGLEGEHEA